MRNLYVPLERDELDNLVALAQHERRRPSDQAALLILKGLNEMTRARQPAIDATTTHDAAAVLEQILGPGFDLVHTKRMGWIIRAWDSWTGRDGKPRDGWREIDAAPDGQLGALLIRHQHRQRGA